MGDGAAPCGAAPVSHHPVTRSDERVDDRTGTNEVAFHEPLRCRNSREGHETTVESALRISITDDADMACAVGDEGISRLSQRQRADVDATDDEVAGRTGSHLVGACTSHGHNEVVVRTDAKLKIDQAFG